MICPNCGVDVRAEETIDNEWRDNGYYDRVEGVCPNCKKIWKWTEVYTWSYDIDIEEITED